MSLREQQPGSPMEDPKRQPKHAPWIAGLIVLVLVVGVILTIKYTRHHVFPKRFAVVEPEQIYRSGRLERWPLERVIEKHNIRTILTLLHDVPGDSQQEMERELARARGVEIIRIPMPGDGCGKYEDIFRAARILGDASKQPILVHCAAGVHRTGATVATYRMLYQGWDFDRAMQEQVDHGYRAKSDPRLMDHMRAFYEQELAERSELQGRDGESVTKP